MKRKTFKCIYSLICCCILIAISCGCEEKITYVLTALFYNGPADFSVTNLTTNQECRYYSGDTCSYRLLLEVIEKPATSQKRDTIIFHTNDKLLLKFYPPEPFRNSDYIVQFLLFDVDTILKYKPYSYEFEITDDIPTGYYDIDCNALSNTWNSPYDLSRCHQSCVIKLE